MKTTAELPPMPPVTPVPPADDLTLTSQRQRKMQLAHEASLLNKAGRLDDLERCLLQLLALDPKDAQALYNLGVIAFKRDERARAERFLRQAVAADPDYVEAYQALGDIFYQSRHLLSAIEVYERGLSHVPTRLPLLSCLLRSCMTLRSAARVEAVARRILNIDDQDADARNFLAWSILSSNGNLAEAKGHLTAVIEARPETTAPLAQAEVLEDRLGNPEGAALYREKLADAIQESWSKTHQAAEAFQHLGRFDRASEIVQAYLKEHGDDAQAHRYLAVTLMQDGDFIAGHKILEDVLKTVHDRPNLQMVYCLNAFRLGDLENFYRFHHTRWNRDGSEDVWDIPVPEWDGKPIANGKLAVQCEQGVGDYVMFAVAFPGLKSFARDVLVKTMHRMLPLFQRSFPEIQFIPDEKLPADVPVESIAAKVAAGDLPEKMGGDIDHLPGKSGILVADPEMLRKLRQRYQTLFPGKRLIGISWRSGNRDSSAMRSLELPHWKPLFDLEDCAFISLQYGDVSRDLEELKAQLGDRVYWDKEINPMGDMDPFTAQLAAMDLIISVDNSTIHFAGGLGKPCWALLPLASDWRWQVERTDTVWYDSLELFRPDKDGGWEGLVERAAKRLATVDDDALRAADVAYLHRSLQTMMRANRVSEAEQYGRLLLAAGEHKAEAMQAVGRSAASAGKHEDAVGILNRAVELDPTNAGIHADLALSLSKTGDPEQALLYAREATRRFPKSDEASVACGKILIDIGRYDEATDYFARTLRRDPQNTQSRLSLAGLQAMQGEWDLARSNYSKVLDVDPANATGHTALAELDLRLGNFEAGWKNFQWRFGVRPGVLPRHLSEIEANKQPQRWTGGNLRKQRLLLLSERNIGEEIMLASLLPEVSEETRRITMECDAPILPLLAASFPSIEVIERRATDLAGLEARKIQMVSTLGELAGRFRGTPESFSRQPQRYLRADPERVAELRRQYEQSLPGKRLVGLSWRNVRNEADLLPLSAWLPLLDRTDIATVALHPGAAEAELVQFSEQTGRDLIFDRRFNTANDLPAYAVQIAACDVVIATEDLTALLANALGVPVVKIRKSVDHWWLGAGQAASPWFPNMEFTILDPGGAPDAAVDRALAHVDRLLARPSGTGRK